jgi:hypothetical protein
VPSPGFEPTTLWWESWRPNHSATTLHKWIQHQWIQHRPWSCPHLESSIPMNRPSHPMKVIIHGKNNNQISHCMMEHYISDRPIEKRGHPWR